MAGVLIALALGLVGVAILYWFVSLALDVLHGHQLGHREDAPTLPPKRYRR